MDRTIIHEGIVLGVLPDGKVSVGLRQAPACSGCSISAHCSVAAGKAKQVDAMPVAGYEAVPGDKVRLLAVRHAATHAVMLGYGCPLLLAVVTLVGGMAFGLPDWGTALLMLLLLAVYFVVLHRTSSLVGQTGFVVEPVEQESKN